MNVYEGVVQVFRSAFENPELELNYLMATGDIREWDSFKNVEILLACEEHFGFRFRSKEIDAIKTVGDLIAVSEKKLAAKSASEKA